MFSTIGIIKGKSLLMQGESENGKWKTINFGLKKQFNKKKTDVYFTAHGSLASTIEKIKVGEKVRIEFFPKSKEYKGRWFTELVAVSVEKYIQKSKLIANEEAPALGILKPSDFQFDLDNEIPFVPQQYASR